jgi:hypothetical protein
MSFLAACASVELPVFSTGRLILPTTFGPERTSLRISTFSISSSLSSTDVGAGVESFSEEVSIFSTFASTSTGITGSDFTSATGIGLGSGVGTSAGLTASTLGSTSFLGASSVILISSFFSGTIVSAGLEVLFLGVKSIFPITLIPGVSSGITATFSTSVSSG